jgi:uncharacterized protein
MQLFPNMHVYHYAAYEPSALKRLMLLHGTREAEVDDLLRRKTFVDLYRVVREAMRTSEPGLSIKNLEVFYMPQREGEVKTAGDSIVHYERWRATQDDAELTKIRSYNEDDCRSTHLLRDWLLGHRPADMPWFCGTSEQEEGGSAASEKTLEIEGELARYREKLLGGLPEDAATWTADEHLRQLLFDLLDFHRRCDKPAWWGMYARQDMTEDDLIEDIECLAGLVRIADRTPTPVNRSLVYAFTYPEQETKLRVGKDCTRTDTGQGFGTIVALDEETRTIEIKVGRERDVPARLSVGPGKPIKSDVLRRAVWRFADSLIADDSRFAAVRALLRKDAPKLRDSDALTRFSDPLQAVLALDDSYLFIQGPPGAGKTTAGSKLILGLLQQGKRVGVTSNSHKVINHLLQAVETRGGAAFHVLRSQAVEQAGPRKLVPGKACSQRVRQRRRERERAARRGNRVALRRPAIRGEARLSLRRRSRAGVAREPDRHGHGRAEHRADRRSDAARPADPGRASRTFGGIDARIPARRPGDRCAGSRHLPRDDVAHARGRLPLHLGCGLRRPAAPGGRQPEATPRVGLVGASGAATDRHRVRSGAS